eukprot:102039-Pelagomonas_calceolata.AAC.3
MATRAVQEQSSDVVGSKVSQARLEILPCHRHPMLTKQDCSLPNGWPGWSLVANISSVDKMFFPAPHQHAHPMPSGKIWHNSINRQPPHQHAHPVPP